MHQWPANTVTKLHQQPQVPKTQQRSFTQTQHTDRLRPSLHRLTSCFGRVRRLGSSTCGLPARPPRCMRASNAPLVRMPPPLRLSGRLSPRPHHLLRPGCVVLRAPAHVGQSPTMGRRQSETRPRESPSSLRGGSGPFLLLTSLAIQRYIVSPVTLTLSRQPGAS